MYIQIPYEKNGINNMKYLCIALLLLLLPFSNNTIKIIIFETKLNSQGKIVWVKKSARFRSVYFCLKNLPDGVVVEREHKISST